VVRWCLQLGAYSQGKELQWCTFRAWYPHILLLSARSEVSSAFIFLSIQELPAYLFHVTVVGSPRQCRKISSCNIVFAATQYEGPWVWFQLRVRAFCVLWLCSPLPSEPGLSFFFHENPFTLYPLCFDPVTCIWTKHS